jgi:hypothetical protein
MRPTASAGPPAANGTTIVTGRVGQSSAPASDAVRRRAPIAAIDRGIGNI